VLAAVLIPRFLSAMASSVSAADGTPTPASGVTVPDLKGKTLDDARTLVGGAGLNLAAGPYINDATPRDMVAVQEPAPGTLLHAGQLVTVSLSLGPQPVKAEPTAVPVSQPAVQPPEQAPVQQPKAQPPANPPGNGHKDEDKDKDKGGPKKGKDGK
jgi:beta-lactam-binding protein with PASTA domain